MPPCLAGPSAAEPLVRRQTTKSTKGNLPHVPIPPRSSPDGPPPLARRSVRPGSLYSRRCLRFQRRLRWIRNLRLQLLHPIQQGAHVLLQRRLVYRLAVSRVSTL